MVAASTLCRAVARRISQRHFSSATNKAASGPGGASRNPFEGTYSPPLSCLSTLEFRILPLTTSFLPPDLLSLDSSSNSEPSTGDSFPTLADFPPSKPGTRTPRPPRARNPRDFPSASTSSSSVPLSSSPLYRLQPSAAIAAETARAAAAAQDRGDHEAQMFRRFRFGDVYAPHDLSGAEAMRWKRAGSGVGGRGAFGTLRPGPLQEGRVDVMRELGMDPRKEYKNAAIMSQLVSPFGRILSRRQTGLSAKNQRRVAKAVKRARGCGLMPTVHKHPMVLYGKWRGL